MAQVIPAIIAHDFFELEEKIKKVEAYADWVQLDVMDGQLVDNVTWYNSEDLKKIDPEILSKINLEAHLMVYKPEKTLDQWINSGIKRIIFHYEATHRKAELIEEIKKAGLEVGLALDMVTPANFIDSFVSSLDMVLVMTVKPGKGGQVFQESMLSKIKSLRQKYPDLPIAVDGGINLESGKKCLEAGASILCAGSYIFDSPNIAEAINDLKKINN